MQDNRYNKKGKRIPKAHRKTMRGDTYQIRLDRSRTTTKRRKSKGLRYIELRIAYELAPCPNDLLKECQECGRHYRRECFCKLLPEKARLEADGSRPAFTLHVEG